MDRTTEGRMGWVVGKKGWKDIIAKKNLELWMGICRKADNAAVVFCASESHKQFDYQRPWESIFLNFVRWKLSEFFQSHHD
jgi:hypothetical protein